MRSDPPEGDGARADGARLSTTRRTLLRSVGVAGTLSLAGCSSLLGVSPDWTADLDEAARAGPPAVIGDTVVVGAQDKALYAVGTENGERRLRVETGGPIESRPAVPDDGEFVHVHSTDGDCYGVHLDDGIRWTVEGEAVDADIERRGPALLSLTDRRDADGYALRAVGASDGSRLWERVIATYRIPTGAGSRTVVPVAAAATAESNDSTRAVALDTATGSTAWSATYEAPPAVAADADLVALLGRTEGEFGVAGYDPADGGRRWRTPIERSPALVSDLALGPHVIVATDGDDGGAAVGVDRESGAVAWRQSPEGQIRDLAAGPETTVVARRVQRDDESRIQLQAYGADGNRRWTTVLDAAKAERTAVVGSTVLASDEHSLAALAIGTGETRWRYESEESRQIAFAATADAAFVSHVDTGELVRLSL